MVDMTASTAYLSFDGGISCFSFGDQSIRFRTSDALEGYLRIKTWDRGYLVVDAVYRGLPGVTEDYIDLVPILENLYMDPQAFCEPIKEVVIK